MTPAAAPPRRVAVIGAGWAGLACAVQAVRAGHAVTLYEAARTAGGRARALDIEDAGQTLRLDNGQHILIGAYTATLGLMRELGVDLPAVLHRLPLTLRFPDGGGLAVPRLPAPLDLAVGILRARGWSWQDKRSLIATAVAWRRAGFECARQATVAALCASLTPRVMAELIEPLCVSALNVPALQASGPVFLRVLRDALFGTPGGADLLVPRADLGALLPDPALAWLDVRGATLRIGQRVQSLRRTGHGWCADDTPFDQAVLAVPAWEAARLAAGCGDPHAARWAEGAAALPHTAIATVYARAADVPGTAGGLPAPMLALRSGPGAPAQFVFDREQLGGPRSVLAFVVSASDGEREALQAQVLTQARDQLGLAGLRPLRTVVERRATFACVPGVSRPAARVAPGLSACGDYVDGPYPATLEGAVRSGLSALEAGSPGADG